MIAKFIKNTLSTLREKTTSNEIVIRAKAKTPAFWKKVQKLFMSIGGLALTLWIANNEFDLQIGEPLLTILRHAIVSSILITGTAQLTKEDKDESAG